MIYIIKLLLNKNLYYVLSSKAKTIYDNFSLLKISKQEELKNLLQNNKRGF